MFPAAFDPLGSSAQGGVAVPQSSDREFFKAYSITHEKHNPLQWCIVSDQTTYSQQHLTAELRQYGK